MKQIYLFLSICFLSCFLQAQENGLVLKSYETFKIPDTQKIIIDGQFIETSWQSQEWGGGDFTVNRPNNGDVPKNQTKFKIIYDNDFIYMAFLCLDDSPEEVVQHMARRDRFPGDWVEINFDSYNDKSTGFSFCISASGVKGDEFITDNGNRWDSSWNPIWYAATEIVDEGWVAEVKIPLSQLRYADEDVQDWGFQMTRRDFKAGERSTYQHIPNNVTGWVSNFARLKGIQGIKAKRQIEIQPYIVSGVKEVDSGDGTSSSKFHTAIGLDGKIGVTPDLTLDFTMNPDFGQVEADPSALNINGFQIFNGERRPFFVENSNLFSFRISRVEADGPHTNDNLFYSRRIGQSPRGNVNVPNGATIKYPHATSILGAAKFSGKTQKGWSIGILESITAEEHAKVKFRGQETSHTVAPLSSYFVGRLSKDIANGDSQIGATLTHVNRFLDKTGLEDQYHSSAISGGVNLLHTWKNREWQIQANLVGSRVQGSALKILETQTSFEHYYQRPDAEHLTVDSFATSLSGHGGRFTIANFGGADNLSFETGVTWRSAGLELNDAGFMNTADDIQHFIWAGYRFPKPFSIFRSLRANYNHYFAWDTDGLHRYTAFNMNAHSVFRNFWEAGTGFNLELKDISTKQLFGGPAFTNFRGIFHWGYVGTDTRNKLRVRAEFGYFTPVAADKDAVSNYYINLSLDYQPSNRLSLSIQPNFQETGRVVQNVDLTAFQNEDRYITGRILQQTLSLSIRGSYNFTPNLTLEYWGQPFVSKAQFNKFKYITDPNAPDYRDRYHLYDDVQIQEDEDGGFHIDENRDGVIDYSFGNPDFNFLQFRSNMVLRWEYTAGSELFLVWSQSATNFGDPEKGLTRSWKDDLFGNSIDNTILVKATYRFVR